MNKKPEKLETILQEHKGETWAILTHRYPDPDAIASQLAAQKILKHYEINSDVFAYGEVSHPSNKAMVNGLEIELKAQEGADLSKYDNILVVDATELNIELPEGKTPLITIDHHDVTQKDLKSKLTDITQKNRGSTSTRMVQYIQELNIPMEKAKDTKLATALFYGIYSDTNSLIDATPAEDDAAKFLRAFYDAAIVKKIALPHYAEHTLEAKKTAIENRYIDGIHLASFAGTLKEKEDLTLVVDDLIKTQGIEIAILYGIFENQILVSLRSEGDQINCGTLAKKLWDEHGSAGGRIKAAGASIPLGYVISGLSKEEQEKLVKKRIKEDILKGLNIEEKTTVSVKEEPKSTNS